MAEFFDKSQPPTESFDAVLAEMRQAHSATMREYADRLQSAHEAEVAGSLPKLWWVERLKQQEAITDRAVGLLREHAEYQEETPLPGSVLDRTNIFLSSLDTIVKE